MTNPNVVNPALLLFLVGICITLYIKCAPSWGPEGLDSLRK